ncbi:KWG Leptospira [Bacteroidales bacterium Barb7]|nr:KWG Leptospira [Bacteroidales bacterium Barb7]
MAESLLKIISDTDCIIYKDTIEVGEIKLNKILEIPLRLGTYFIEVVNKNDEANRLSFDYSVETPEIDDLLRVSLKNLKINSSNNVVKPLQIDIEGNLKRYIKEKDNHYSILDTDTNFEIPLKYDEVLPFSDGLARVRIGRLYGYIDMNGKVVIPIKYNDVRPFSDGLALVRIGDLYGYIDKNGKEVIPLQFSSAESFHNGLAIAVDGGEGLIDKTGNFITSNKYYSISGGYDGYYSVQLMNKRYGDSAGCGYIDRTGKEVIKPVWGYRCIEFITSDLLRVSKNNLLGVINIQDEIIIPIVYESVSLMLSYEHILVKQNGKSGLMDIQGTPLTPCKYDAIERFDYNENMAHVVLNNKHGFINEKGEEVIKAVYDLACNFNNGVAVVKEEAKYGLIDKTGNNILPLEYDSVDNGCSEDVVKIAQNGKWGCATRKGEIILPIEYDEINFPIKGVIWMRKEDDWSSIKIKS